ncbi:hypothetical protein FQN54_001824 [Arachnomyces sp. PD_36]|nr:hypothetical protein FQN54_001824 [Arachnomyces sp. PD_36]
MAAVGNPSSSRFRDMGRSNRSSRSDGSVASYTTFSDVNSEFEPDQDVLASSTRQFDNPNRLPKPYQGTSQHEQQEEQNFAIDTSALQRAFPDFSSHAISSDEDDDISVEMGRGGKKSSHKLDDSRNSIMSLNHSVRSSSPAIRLDSPPVSTPPRSALRNVSNRGSTANNLRKGAQLRQASLAMKETDTPEKAANNGKQRTVSGDQRRTLSEMHAKVAETYDGSYLSDEKPAAVTTNTRSTRFGRAKSGEYTADGAQGTEDQAEHAKQYPNGASANNTMSDMPTQRSFMIPDLPNLSELVSGVYQDGTPVFSRQGKPRTTRFISPSHTNTETRPGHMDVGSVPVPDDEKAIFVSLRLLQEKVAQLELEKSETERNAEEMRQEVMTLKSENVRRQKRERHRSSCDDDGLDKRSRKLAIEKSRLEATNLALQNEADVAERKIVSHENNLRKLTRERDAAVSQLGIAYLSSQELKAENHALVEENEKLKRQLAKLLGGNSRKSAQHEEDTARSQETDRQMTTRDVGDATESNYAIHQSITERSQREGARSRSAKHRSQTPAPSRSQAKISNQINEQLSKLDKQQEDDSLFSLDLPSLRPQSGSKGKMPVKASHEKKPNTGKQRVKKVVVEDIETSDEDSEDDMEAVTGELKTRSEGVQDQDMTVLSFIDTQEIAALRKTLEEERAARKRQSQIQNDPTRTETMASAYSSKHTQNLPRKSSLKNATATLTRPVSAGGDPTMTHRTNGTDGDAVSVAPSQGLSKNKNRSEESLSRRRRRQAADGMTSAFILPDITIQNQASGIHDHVTLSSSAQRVMDETTQHQANNCFVCKRVVTEGTNHTHHGKGSITVPKPVPVSERMPEPSVYNEEPTLRPSQPPAVALATVMKGLEDELAHLKLQLAKYQNLYNRHDASISKRQRKAIYQKIESLLKEIDTKADQIYSLYDVLEGQKQDGHEFTDEEVEVTLQSIGIDAPTGDFTNRLNRNNSRGKPASTREELETDDEELPWEGIESTVEFTERSVGSRRAN